jgi:aminocarboxymuconate-semialdehyde decarboxylase
VSAVAASPVVDIHNHGIPRELYDAIGEGSFEGYGLVEDSGRVYLTLQGNRFYEVVPERWDMDLRVRAMDGMGVTIQELSMVPQLQGFHLPSDQGARFCRLANEALVGAAASRPGRFVPLGIVPLQDPAEAVRELRRIHGELGMNGIEIGANVVGRDISDPALLPFWEAVAELDMFVFVHPTSNTLSGRERMADYHLSNVIGNPLDSSLAIGNLIFGGHLERWPSLKICFSHAGGFVPYQIGRFDHAYEVRPEAKRAIPKPPSVYLKRLYFDTISHSVAALRYLADLVGPGQLLLGTDYPADMADMKPLETVAGLELDPADRAGVVGGTAARLLGIGAA